jgi:hypothetical protein
MATTITMAMNTVMIMTTATRTTTIMMTVTPITMPMMTTIITPRTAASTMAKASPAFMFPA